MRHAIEIDSEKLSYFRKKKKLSQEELGRALGGLRKATISGWETGRKPVSPWHYDRLCEVLGVSIDEIRKPTQEELDAKRRAHELDVADNIADDEIDAHYEYGSKDFAPLAREIGNLKARIGEVELEKQKWLEVNDKKNAYIRQQYIEHLREELVDKQGELERLSSEHLRQQQGEAVKEEPAVYGDKQPELPDKCESCTLIPYFEKGVRRIPLISFAQAAGYDGIMEPVDAYAIGCGEEAVEFSNAQDHDFALRVKGDSMLPLLPDGSIIHVRGGGFPQSGNIVVARIRDTGQVVVKRMLVKDDEIYLKSVNGGKEFHWKRNDASLVEWMYPVVQMKQVF